MSQNAYTIDQSQHPMICVRWHTDASAEVLQTYLMSVFLHAIFIFAPPKMPYKITTSERDAALWCQSVLAKHAQAAA